MKYNQIFAIMVVMILLGVNVSFAADDPPDVTYSSSRQNYYNPLGDNPIGYYSSAPRDGNYLSVTGSKGSLVVTAYENNQPRIAYTIRGDAPTTPSSTVPSGATQIAGMQRVVDTTGDGKVTDADALRYVDYFGTGSAMMYVDQRHVYATSGENRHRGSDYDSQTQTYIPDRTTGIRLGANNRVYADITGDERVDNRDLDLDRDGKVSSSELNNAAVQGAIYDHNTRRFSTQGTQYVGSGGTVYASRTATKEEGTNFQYYPTSRAYSYDPSLTQTRMVVGGSIVLNPDGTTQADVFPDDEGGYYHRMNVNINIPEGEYHTGTESVHYVSQGLDENGKPVFVGVVTAWGVSFWGGTTQYIFSDSNRGKKDGGKIPEEGNVFGMASSVTVTDDWLSHFGFLGPDDRTGVVIRGEDGDLYLIDGSWELDQLLSEGTRKGRKLTDDDEEQIFGTGGINVWETYNIYRFGVALDDFSETTEGYSGFSMFYEPEDYDFAWSGADSEFVKTMYGGEFWFGVFGDFCQEDAADTVGGNVVGGSDTGSPSAYVLAEQYSMPDPDNPEASSFLYLIEVFVYTGSNAPISGCNKLKFKVIIIYAAGGTKALYKNDVTGGDYEWEIGEGESIAYVSDSLLAATSTYNRIGDQICIEFTEVVTGACMRGLDDNNMVCATINAYGTETHDYECDDWWCGAFIGGQTGWQYGETAAAAVPTGVPVPTTPTTPTGSPIPLPSLD